MLTLAIDTSTKTGGAAVVDDNHVLGEYVLDIERKTHSERVIPAIDNVLKGIGITMKDIGAVAVAYGPGSFTGLRIGLATAKALSLSLDIPVYKVDTLEALASQLSYVDGLILPLFNARRGEIYGAIWQSNTETLSCLKPSIAESLEEFLESVPQEQKLFFLGEGAVTAQEQIQNKFPEAIVVKGTNSYLHPASVAFSALKYAPVDVDLLVPNYLRKSEAEIKRDNKISDK